MPRSKQHESSVMADSVDWEVRALAITQALDTAADELRALIESLRAAADDAADPEEGLEHDARNES